MAVVKRGCPRPARRPGVVGDDAAVGLPARDASALAGSCVAGYEAPIKGGRRGAADPGAGVVENLALTKDRPVRPPAVSGVVAHNNRVRRRSGMHPAAIVRHDVVADDAVLENAVVTAAAVVPGVVAPHLAPDERRAVPAAAALRSLSGKSGFAQGLRIPADDAVDNEPLVNGSALRKGGIRLNQTIGDLAGGTGAVDAATTMVRANLAADSGCPRRAALDREALYPRVVGQPDAAHGGVAAAVGRGASRKALVPASAYDRR